MLKISGLLLPVNRLKDQAPGVGSGA